jgi:hypothetical protein
VRGAVLELPRELEAGIEADGRTVDIGKAHRTFPQVCEDIEALSLYFVYGAEGQFVHASPLTINAYCHASAGWWPGLAGEACSR